jgi:Tfp pilus assembly protein PilF
MAAPSRNFNAQRRYLVNQYLTTTDCYYSLGDLGKAQGDFINALSLDKSSEGARARIAFVYNEIGMKCFNNGDFINAEKFFSQAISAYKSHSDLFLNRAKAMLRLNVSFQCVLITFYSEKC